MKITKLSLLFVFILVFAFMDSVGAQSDKIDLEQVRKAINEFEQALIKADMETVMAMYSEDAMLMPLNAEIIKGKQAIKDMWKSGNYKTFEFVHDGVELSGSGDFVYEISRNYTIKIQQKDQKPKTWGPGKFVRIWKKQADGSWKLHVEIWSENQPPSET